MEDEFKGGVVISPEEFDERVKAGEKLVILDDNIIDLTMFAYSHPGGTFLIDINVGKDVGKFFFGGYAFDQNKNIPGDKNLAHTHSNIARKIANKHIIGVIGSSLSRHGDPTVRFAIDHAKDFPLNKDITSFNFVSMDNQNLKGIQSYYP